MMPYSMPGALHVRLIGDAVIGKPKVARLS